MAKVVVKTLDSEDEVKYVKLRVQGHSKLFGVPLESNANLSISKLQMILPKAMALIIECHSDITLLMPKNGYFNQPEEGWEKVLISVVLNEQTSNIRRIPRPAATTQSTASSTDAPAIEVVKEAQEEEAAKKAAAQQAAGSSHPAESRLSEATAQSTASSTDAPAAAAVEPDPWDFAESVDILPQLFNNFQELIASKKWQERKEALEGFLALATDNIRLDPKANYNEIVATLTKILSKDANINVCAVAAKCITQLAKGLRSKFANHAPSIIEVIFEKFKVKKDLLRDPLIEAIDAIYATTTIEAVSENVVTALEKPNPTIKIQTNQFLCRVFKALNAQTAPKKVIRTLTPLIAKCTGESDAEAREAAFSALGAIMKAIGKNDTMLMLGDVANDKTKMERIEKFYNQAVEEAQEEEAAKKAAAQQAISISTLECPASALANYVFQGEIMILNLLKVVAKSETEIKTVLQKKTIKAKRIEILLTTLKPKVFGANEFDNLLQAFNGIENPRLQAVESIKLTVDRFNLVEPLCLLPLAKKCQEVFPNVKSFEFLVNMQW